MTVIIDLRDTVLSLFLQTFWLCVIVLFRRVVVHGHDCRAYYQDSFKCLACVVNNYLLELVQPLQFRSGYFFSQAACNFCIGCGVVEWFGLSESLLNWRRFKSVGDLCRPIFGYKVAEFESHNILVREGLLLQNICERLPFTLSQIASKSVEWFWRYLPNSTFAFPLYDFC